jgi:hypothetical protein
MNRRKDGQLSLKGVSGSLNQIFGNEIEDMLPPASCRGRSSGSRYAVANLQGPRKVPGQSLRNQREKSRFPSRLRERDPSLTFFIPSKNSLRAMQSPQGDDNIFRMQIETQELKREVEGAESVSKKWKPTSFPRSIASLILTNCGPDSMKLNYVCRW